MPFVFALGFSSSFSAPQATDAQEMHRKSKAVAKNRKRARMHASLDREAFPLRSVVADPGIPTFRTTLSSRIPDWLLDRLEHLSLHTPTTVQACSLQLSLGETPGTIGRDVVLHAETGSGKTLAYLLPLLSSLDLSRNTTQALVLVPTQELCAQVTGTARQLAAAAPQPLPVLALLDSPDSARRQAQQLRAGAPRVVVGNVRAILSLADAGRLRLDLVRVLVVDEVDAILGDTAATAALQRVLAVRFREGDRQTMFASATVPQQRHFLRQCVTQRWTRPDIVHIELQERVVPEGLQHFFVMCARGRKVGALRALLAADKDERVMVFAARVRDVEAIAEALAGALGVEVAAIDEGLHGVERRESFSRFKKGELRVLVATDLAARGLDLPDVAVVYHLDLPTDADAYLHRAGRSARAGKVGRSVVLLEDGEQFVISRIANKLDIEFQRIRKDSVAS